MAQKYQDPAIAALQSSVATLGKLVADLQKQVAALKEPTPATEGPRIDRTDGVLRAYDETGALRLMTEE